MLRGVRVVLFGGRSVVIGRGDCCGDGNIALWLLSVFVDGSSSCIDVVYVDRLR